MDDIHILQLSENKFRKIQRLKLVRCPKRDKFHACLIHGKVHLFGLRQHTKDLAMPIERFFDELRDKKEVRQTANVATGDGAAQELVQAFRQSKTDLNAKIELDDDEKAERKDIVEDEEKRAV